MIAIQATLGDTNAHQILALIQGVIGKAPDPFCCQLDIQADPGNAGNVLVGDANLTAARYGKQLAAGGTHTFGPQATNSVSLLDPYVQASAAGQKVNILVSAF